MNPIVFISHVKEDEKFARELANGLSLYLLDPWIFENVNQTPGSYLKQVRKAIEDSEAFIFILTSNLILKKSHNVHSELIFAHESGKKLIFISYDIDNPRELVKKYHPDWDLIIGANQIIQIQNNCDSALMSTIANYIIKGENSLSFKHLQKPGKNCFSPLRIFYFSAIKKKKWIVFLIILILICILLNFSMSNRDGGFQTSHNIGSELSVHEIDEPAGQFIVKTEKKIILPKINNSTRNNQNI